MNVKYDFNREFFRQRIASLGYRSCKDFCRVNEINHNTLCNTIYRHHLSFDMICRLALILECAIDDLLLYGEE